MTAFERALAFTLDGAHGWLGETGGDPAGGGHVDPDDPGGYTRWGIASAFHPGVDVAHLTRDGARAIYLERYWLEARCQKLPELVAITHFDHAVNRGVGQAAEALQAVVGATIDGDVGPRTLAALDLAIVRHGERVVAAALVGARIGLHLAKAKPVHRTGLLRRCVALLELVLEGDAMTQPAQPTPQEQPPTPIIWNPFDSRSFLRSARVQGLLGALVAVGLEVAGIQPDPQTLGAAGDSLSEILLGIATLRGLWGTIRAQRSARPF